MYTLPLVVRHCTPTTCLTNGPTDSTVSLPQGVNNQVVDLTAPEFAMPPSGQTSFTNLNYDTTAKCGFQELYAAQEWGELQFAVSFIWVAKACDKVHCVGREEGGNTTTTRGAGHNAAPFCSCSMLSMCSPAANRAPCKNTCL